MRLQVGRQMFEINSGLSKIVQNSLAVSSVSRKSFGQLAVIAERQKSFLRHCVDRVWRSQSTYIKDVGSLWVFGAGTGKQESLRPSAKVGQTLSAVRGEDIAVGLVYLLPDGNAELVP